METKKLVVGNMKMCLTAPEINKYLKTIDKKEYGKQVVLCPSSLYLPYFVGKSYEVGIQNIAAYENGAYTGEISASQVKSMHVHYVIIGHSERRSYFKENEEIISKKIAMAQKENLKVILCIGETEEERDSLKTYKVLKKQLTSAMKGMDTKEANKMMIAYEPIWAIGTNKTPNNTEIKDTIDFIKSIVKDLCKIDINVLYGGSINDENITTLNKIPNVDGYLVGGASTKADKFMKIIEVVVNQ